jgi:hypothetical protein
MLSLIGKVPLCLSVILSEECNFLQSLVLITFIFHPDLSVSHTSCGNIEILPIIISAIST